MAAAERVQRWSQMGLPQRVRAPRLGGSTMSTTYRRCADCPANIEDMRRNTRRCSRCAVQHMYRQRSQKATTLRAQFRLAGLVKAEADTPDCFAVIHVARGFGGDPTPFLFGQRRTLDEARQLALAALAAGKEQVSIEHWSYTSGARQKEKQLALGEQS